jgi:uncharacterized membrane protein YccC
MTLPPLLAAWRRGLARYLSELHASQEFLASEVGHGGWLDFGQFRWQNVTPGRAARAAFGVLTPLIIGAATGHLEYGTFAALGAVPAGLVSFQGVTRSRVVLVALAAAGMALSTFAGAAAAARAPWALVPAVVAWAYLAGVCSVLGPAAIVVSLQWPVALLIASAIPLPPGQAAIRAGLVLAGGLWQGALVVSSWAVSRGSAERAAIAESYALLSDYAGQLASGHAGPPPPEALPGSTVLRDPNPLLRNAARRHLIDGMEEAERIRTTLTALGGQDAVGPRRQELLTSAAGALGQIAEALSDRPGVRTAHLEQARQRLRAGPGSAGHPWTWAGEALEGQLRSAVRITERLNDAEPGRAGRAGAVPARPPARLPARDLLVTLRASLGTSSEAGRHAIRLAVVTGLAEVIAQAVGLPHGYWVALTVLIVLRPDYGSTLYRGLQRAGGTIVGAGLGIATVLLGHFGDWALLAGLGVSLLTAYTVLTVNYLFFAIFLTDFVVVLLALLGLPADQTALDRLAGTCIGAALALLAYLLWPTWERTSASEKFGRLFLAQGRYASGLLDRYGQPGTDPVRESRGRKLAARRARADAEASADRLADEPDRLPVSRELAQALVSSGHRLALASLALEAAAAQQQVQRAGGGATHPDPAQLGRLADAVRQAAGQLAESLRRLGPPGPLPPLREIQSGLGAGADDQDALVTATDSLVDALNTAAHILRRHLGQADSRHEG